MGKKHVKKDVIMGGNKKYYLTTVLLWSFCVIIASGLTLIGHLYYKEKQLVECAEQLVLLDCYGNYDNMCEEKKLNIVRNDSSYFSCESLFDCHCYLSRLLQ